MIRHTVLTLMTCAVLVGSAHAGQQRTSTDTWGGGVLVSVDAPSRTIVVRQGELEQRYSLGEGVDVREGRSSLAVAELDKGVGRQVTIRYELDGETRIANRVNVLNRRGSVTAAAPRTGSGGTGSQP